MKIQECLGTTLQPRGHSRRPLHLNVAHTIQRGRSVYSNLRNQGEGEPAALPERPENGTTARVPYRLPRHLCCAQRHSGRIHPDLHSLHLPTLHRPISSDELRLSQQALNPLNLRETSKPYVLVADHRSTGQSFCPPKASRPSHRLSSGTPMFILFLYIITIVGAISSVTPTNAYPFAQVIPVPISPGTLGSSSINWWPYTNVAVTSNAIIVPSMVQTPMLMPSPTTTTTTATSSLPSSIYSSTTINTISRTINSTTSGTTSSTSSLIQVSPSSSSSSSPTSTSAGGTPRPGFKIAYLFPVSVLLGAILGASFVAVCFRRWRQRYKEDSLSRHHWPADGGFIPVTDHRDEEEKKWTAERRSHSEEEYETDSDVDVSHPRHTARSQRRRLPGAHSQSSRARQRSNSFTTVLQEDDRIAISESFYDYDRLGSLKEVNLSSDEEPPASFMKRGGSSCSPQDSQGDWISSAIGRTSGAISAPPLRVPHASSTQALSPPLIRDLFFLDGPVNGDETRWVTAERLLQGDQDSEEEDILQDAIASAGTSHMGEDDMQNGPGVPTSLSALSIIPVGRRLVKSTRMGKGASSRVSRYRDSDLSTVEENIRTTRDETRPSDAAYSHNLDQRLSSQSAAFGRIAEILHARWSQRNLSQGAPSLSSYGSDDNNARVGSSAGQANFTFHFNRSMTESIEQRLCPSVIDHDSRG